MPLNIDNMQREAEDRARDAWRRAGRALGRPLVGERTIDIAVWFAADRAAAETLVAELRLIERLYEESHARAFLPDRRDPWPEDARPAEPAPAPRCDSVFHRHADSVRCSLSRGHAGNHELHEGQPPRAVYEWCAGYSRTIAPPRDAR